MFRNTPGQELDLEEDRSWMEWKENDSPQLLIKLAKEFVALHDGNGSGDLNNPTSYRHGCSLLRYLDKINQSFLRVSANQWIREQNRTKGARMFTKEECNRTTPAQHRMKFYLL